MLTATRSADFVAEARKAAELPRSKSIEFNVPATLLMLLEVREQVVEGQPIDKQLTSYRLALRDARACAEEGMVQIALLNEGINPGSAFIIQAVAKGWRYRIDKGFYFIEVNHD